MKNEGVLNYFEQITRIPRPSHHEEKIAQFLVDFAKAHNLEVIKDDFQNVIIKKPGHNSSPKASTVILQGHTDMVCVKTPECTKDMFSEGIDMYEEDGWIRARGTSLGGDNGVAVAMMMDILASDDITHPPLECLFTSTEETGLVGATNLDPSNLSGKILINLDSEDEGIFTLGCAGGGRADISKEYFLEPNDSDTYRLTLKDFTGGHSGMNIAEYRANTCMLLIQILAEISFLADLRLISIEGGGIDNAIPAKAVAEFSFSPHCYTLVSEKMETLTESILSEYKHTDTKGSIIFEKISENRGSALSENDTTDLLSLIYSMPNGVVRMSNQVEGLVETSLNLGILSLKGGVLKGTHSLRSSVNSAFLALKSKLTFLAKSRGADINFRDEYPGWPYKEVSPLRDIALKTYEEFTGKEAKVNVIHAGLECGILIEKMPGLDAISFGPDLRNVHSTDEALSKESFIRTYEFLKKLLENLSK